MNIEKHIQYWFKGAEEDLEVAEKLVKDGKMRHGLFFAHLSLEKILKANVVKTLQKIPPKIHNLLRLADLADLELSDEQKVFLRQFDLYQLEGRYPDSMDFQISSDSAEMKLQEARKFKKWIMEKL